MVSVLPWAALLFAILDWIAVAKNYKSIRYISKPGVMLALLVWIGISSVSSRPMVWFFFGALFSLGGDIFLLLPKEKFIAGLLSFLVGHVAYIIGFNRSIPLINLASLTLIVLIAMPAAQVYRRIAAALSSSQRDQLKVPVFIYTLVISLMVFSALLTLVRPDDQWGPYPALLVSAGALLFFISDALLAWNRYVETLNHGHLKVIVLYHLGQFGILLGAALQFIK